jgi:hypothetical protein
MNKDKPGNIREAAFKELYKISIALESDPEMIDSMSVAQLRTEMREMGLDADKPLVLFPTSDIGLLDSTLPSRLGAATGTRSEEPSMKHGNPTRRHAKVISIRSKQFLGNYGEPLGAIPEKLIFIAGVVLTFWVPALFFCSVIGQVLPLYLLICDHLLGGCLGVLMFSRSAVSSGSVVPKNLVPRLHQCPQDFEETEHFRRCRQ